jgi:LPS-assembly lipoprotein
MSLADMGKTDKDQRFVTSLRVRSLAQVLLVAVLLLPALTACGGSGFRPLYGSSSVGGADAAEKLAQVQVGKIPGRVGQVIRNELIFDTTGGGNAEPAKYRLDIAIRESVTSTLVRQDGEAASEVYNIDASFKLTRLDNKSVALQGKSYAKSGYNRFTSIYSNVRARRNAEDLAARTISEDLKTRIAAYLAGTA